MRNCAGSAILMSPSCPPVAARVAGREPPLLPLSDMPDCFSCWLWPRRVRVFAGLHGAFEGGDQGRASHAQLGLVMQRELAQYLFAFWSQREQHLTPVFASTMPP